MPLLLLMLFLGAARAQLAAKPTRGPHPASPCPSVFSYEGREPERNRWYGVVLVSSDEPLDGLRLNVKLTHRAQILGNFIGDVSTADNVEFTILNLKMRVIAGPPVPIRIFAAFGDRDDIPYIENIKLNGRTICSGVHPEQQSVIAQPPRSRPASGLEYDEQPRPQQPPPRSRPASGLEYDGQPRPQQPPPRPRPAGGQEYDEQPPPQSRPQQSGSRQRPSGGLEFEEMTRPQPRTTTQPPPRTTSTPRTPAEPTETNYYSNSVSSGSIPATSPRSPPPQQQNREDNMYNMRPARNNYTAPAQETERGIYRMPGTSTEYSPPRIAMTDRPEQQRLPSSTPEPTSRPQPQPQREDANAAPQPWPTSNYDERPAARPRPPRPGPDSNPEPPEPPKQQLVRPARQSRCGTIAPPATPLIINGETSIPGKWPWHVALYKPHGRDWKYQCGGSLVSQTVVVTAAHCVTTSVGRPVAPESLLVFLGKHALRTTTEDGVQDKHVYFIHVHPSYNYTNYRNDIAVLILSSPATVTSAVRPVCLWDRDRADLSHVEGKFGTVVGWGIETDGLLTEELHQALMPVVSPAICIYSYPSFFGVYTSNKTYCAGYSPDQLNAGTSVCNGDSGGGMFFKRDEEVPDDEAVWMLRGLVSLSVRTKQDRCDPSHFVVFTDVAKYGDWLENFLAT